MTKVKNKRKSYLCGFCFLEQERAVLTNFLARCITDLQIDMNSSMEFVGQNSRRFPILVTQKSTFQSNINTNTVSTETKRMGRYDWKLTPT